MIRRTERRKQGITVLLLIIMFLCFLGYWLFPKALYDQQAATRYGSKDNRYAQTTVFFSNDLLVEQDTINQYRVAIQNRLQELVKDMENDSARLWVDAYSSQKKSIVNTSTSSSNVMLYGVGGEFFLFHPYQLLYGSFFNEDDSMKNKVVLDEHTAWNLFGSSNVVGRSVEIEGKTFYISAVYRLTEHTLLQGVMDESKLVFISYDAYEKLEEATIMNYEILMPNPVKNYARTCVVDSIGENVDTEEVSQQVMEEKLPMEIVENSGRFGVMRSLGRLKEHFLRSIVQNKVSYPYWENEALVVEDVCSGLVGVGMIILLLIIVKLLRVLKRIISSFQKNKLFLNKRNQKVYNE